MSNNTIKISEMEENQNISQDDIIEVSAFNQQQETYTSKKLSLARLGNWINSFLGKLITKFSSENISLTEAVNRLFDTAGGNLSELNDVSIKGDTLEPRPSNRYSSVLVYDQTMGKWTNEAYPFIEYQGVIRGENTSPITVVNPQTGELEDEHIIVPAGINIIDSKIFVDVNFYGNFATDFGYTDVQETSEEQENSDEPKPKPKPKKLEITFKHSPYEMTGDLNSSMNYKLRIWT